MSFASLLARALRPPLYHYCRRMPIAAGKVKLIYLTRRIEAAEKKPVVLPNGTTMIADLSEAVQRLVYFLGHYEPGVSRVITQTLKPGDIFIDIGAHVGYFTLLASTRVGPEGKIFSFEPQPQVFLDLEQNVKLNRLDNVRMFRSAVFDANQDLEIFLPVEGNTGTASFIKRPDAPGTSINCPATTLDSFIERESIGRIKLIKMDIEGAEPFALKGMSRLLASDFPPDIICEAVPFLLEISGHKQRDLVDFLDGFGYTGRLISNDGLANFDPDRDQSPTADCNLYFSHSRTLKESESIETPRIQKNRTN